MEKNLKNKISDIEEKDIVFDECLGNFNNDLEMTNSLNNLDEVVELKTEKKKKNRKIFVPIIASLLLVIVLSGVSYAYYKARVTKIRETETTFRTNVLGLIYTGVHEIDVSGVIPGDSFTKTFTVENVSNRAVDFNLFIEEITSTFNEDLKITVTDNKGNTVVSRRAMPVTNPGKEYIATSIPIDAGELITYTMTIEYIYSESADQSDYMGAEFEGHVMIDTELLNTAQASALDDGTVIYYNPELNQRCDNYVAANSNDGNASGCLKWYAFNDNVNKSKITLLLDHNTVSGTTYDNVNSSLISVANTNNWYEELNVRSLKYSEISNYFDSNSGEKNVNSSMNSDWLFDNVIASNDYVSNSDEYYTGHYSVNNGSTGYNIIEYYTCDGECESESNRTYYKKLTVDDQYYSESGARPVVTVSKTVLGISYQDLGNEYEDGTAVYFNPETNQKCNDYVATNSNSTVASGCLKWYAFNDDGGDTIALLLDHNVAEGVGYSTGYEEPKSPSIANGALNTVASNNNWHTSLTPRLIKYDEISKYFVQKSGSSDFVLSDESGSWLFSNVSDGYVYYYNIVNQGHYLVEGGLNDQGYAIAATDDSYDGKQKLLTLNSNSYVVNGVRPVIEVQKSVLN